MTIDEIIKGGIEKAIKNGWKPLPDNVELTVENVLANWHHMPIAIFFRQDWARAFYGTHMVCEGCGEIACNKVAWCEGKGTIEAWENHIMLQALEENRLAYIRRFL